MYFKVISNNSELDLNARNKVFLLEDSWDDWFEFNTQYYMVYLDENGEKHEIGHVKIGQFRMISDQRRANVPKNFDYLDSQFFSLGQDDGYYETIKEINSDIFEWLNDIALKEDIYNDALNERVTRVSLLRSVSQLSIEGQFRRLTLGEARLTPYKFSFTAPRFKGSTSPNLYLSFDVIPESNPPTNVNVIIGRNGVGKTELLNNMLNSLMSSEKVTKYGIFKSDDEQLFSNLVSVTFSAFDESEPLKEQRDKTKGLQYSYIGLKRIKEEGKMDSLPKSTVMLKNEFLKSLEKCQHGIRKKRWIAAVHILESDPMFEEAKLIDIIDEENIRSANSNASTTFKKLSSGHKIVLLTITRLVETVEERSLVLLDEPESHLHPPLLSAFIRALSNLLIQRNGVAIIATHSPVILQEVPASCIWKLRRTGLNAVVERLERESFGENVGLLTQEVFGLEVTKSGFYNILKQAIQDNITYSDLIIRFESQLGMEARAIARVLVSRQQEF